MGGGVLKKIKNCLKLWQERIKKRCLINNEAAFTRGRTVQEGIGRGNSIYYLEKRLSWSPVGPSWILHSSAMCRRQPPRRHWILQQGDVKSQKDLLIVRFSWWSRRVQNLESETGVLVPESLTPCITGWTPGILSEPRVSTVYDVHGHAHHIILLSASHLQNMSKKVLRARHYLSVGIIHLRAPRTARQSKPSCVPCHSAVSDSCDPTDCSLPGSSVHGIL